MLDIIKNGIGYVTMTFSDNSVKVIRTTINSQILHEKGVGVKPNTFFDLDKYKYYKFRDDVVDISVSKEKPQFDSEVINFANKFI